MSYFKRLLQGVSPTAWVLKLGRRIQSRAFMEVIKVKFGTKIVFFGQSFHNFMGSRSIKG